MPSTADPYRRWAELTRWQRLRPGGSWPRQLSFVVERAESSPDWTQLRSDLAASGVSIPTAYDAPLPDGKVARFATLRLQAEPKDTPSQVEARIQQIVAHPQVARLQLGYPRGADRDQPGNDAARSRDAPAEPEEADVVLGVIDDGCAFAHPALLGAHAAPRIAVLWQQTTRDPASAPWTKPARFDHGRILERTAMIGLMQDARRAGEVDERLLYQLAYTIDDEADPASAVTPRWPKPNRALLTRASHGTSVLGLAAAPVRAAYDLPDLETRCHRPYGGALPGGAAEPATSCPLVCVDLPREQVEISSGRWMPVNALDGLRFILAEARQRFRSRTKVRKLPVVANLSSGALAGAHVGEAMLERAMDELLVADDDLAIVLAAGNSREADAHVELSVPPGGRAEVGLFVPPSQPFDTCVEIWLPETAELQHVSIEVTTAAGARLEVRGGLPESVVMTTAAATPATGIVQAALLLYPSVVQATGRTMALLSIAGTTVTSRRRDVPRAGPWTIAVSNAGPQVLTAHAWVERDEVVFGTRREQVARFFPQGPQRLQDPDPVRDELRTANTLSNIATGARALPVGAFRGRSKCDDFKGTKLFAGPVSDYSGRPTEPVGSAPRSYLPLAAVADAGKSHPGIRAIGNRGDTLRRMNGTSAAAPQAARYFANEMARGLTRTQIVGALPPLPANPVPARVPAVRPAALAPDPADGRLRLGA